ncbi:MAG: uroporphyrinogen decarboxylase family protein [Melioribacteraceae bacterium]
MNSLERYIKTIKGEHVDHLARIPIVMQFAAEYINSNYGKFASDYNVLVEANIRCAEDFGFDQLSAISDPYRETHGFGAEIAFPENEVPRCVTLPLKSKNFSELKKPDPYNSERMFDRIKAIKLYKEKCANQYSIMGWVEGPAAEAADLYGISEFLTEIMLDPEFTEELLDKCTEAAIDFAKAQFEAGADTIGIGDAIASQVSPELYEAFILPREKKIVDAIKQMGGFVRLHICGNITHLLLGISTLDIDILDIDYLVNMKEAREILGTKIVLSGNIDPVSGVKNGTPESISEIVNDIYGAVGNPLMVCAGCEIPSRTPNENLKSLCKPIKYVK